jgi:hypothetical protein
VGAEKEGALDSEEVNEGEGVEVREFTRIVALEDALEDIASTEGVLERDGEREAVSDVNGRVAVRRGEKVIKAVARKEEEKSAVGDAS